MGLYDRDYMKDKSPAGMDGGDEVKPWDWKRIVIVIVSILAILGLLFFL